MKTIKIFMAALSWIPLLLISCTAQGQYVHEPRTKGEIQRFTAVRYIGSQGIQAKMLYMSEKGYVKIIFRDENKLLIPIVKEKKVKALIQLSSGTSREFYFYNMKEFGRFFYSYTDEAGSHQVAPTETLYARKSWLQNQSGFILKVWLPIDGVTYPIEYRYSRSNDI